jgi:hypothetical protein
MPEGPHGKAPAPDDGASKATSERRLGAPAKRSFTTRQAEQRAALVAQSWPDFLRDLAIRAAIIAAVVVVLAVVVWLARR